MCNEEEGWRQILWWEETKTWKEELVGTSCKTDEPEVGIRRTATNKGNDKLQKTVLKHIWREVEKVSAGAS
jgi:hypothetical protein